MLAIGLLALSTTASIGGASGARAAVPINPSVSATATPSSGSAPLQVNFSATGSGGFSPYTFSWDFGDGSPTATGASVLHVYSGYGDFTVVVTLTDYYGATATDNVTVAVAPSPLSVSLTAVPSIVSVSATTLLETSIQGGVAPYSVAWSGLPPGCPPQPVENYSCQPTASGNYTLVATVTDALGATSAATFVLRVLGGPPPSGQPVGSSSPGEPLVLWLEIGALVVAVVVLAAVIGIVVRRRRRRPGAGG